MVEVIGIVGDALQTTSNVSDEYPKVYTDIHLEYVFYGEGIAVSDVERAIELSTTKYCAVSAMLRPAVSITHSYRIETEARQAADPILAH